MEQLIKLATVYLWVGLISAGIGVLGVIGLIVMWWYDRKH